MKSLNNQITLYYHPKSNKSKQILAYAKTHNLAILEIDLSNEKLTGTHLLYVSRALNIPLEKLANRDTKVFKDLLQQSKNFSDRDWICIYKKHPELIYFPIAFKGNKAILVNTPTDILRL